jgi:catechol 2,3-dioxygenase-like lactoylglutathione lyase family enzyme
MTITWRLEDADGGTALHALHEGLPPGVAPADNELGHRQTLAKLAALVERAVSGQPIAVIDHTGIGVTDVRRAAAFYDAALGALGLRRVIQLPERGGLDAVGYGLDYPVFWIDRFHPPAARQHTAFSAKTRAEVDSFHAAALHAGGTDNGAPGLRDPSRGYPRGYYAAFVRDPDGNNVEAVFRERVAPSTVSRGAAAHETVT